MPSTLTSIAAMRVKRTCGIVALLGNSPDDAKTGNSCVFSILLQGSRGRPTLALPPAARRVLSDDTWQEAQVRRGEALLRKGAIIRDYTGNGNYQDQGI